MIKLIEKHYKWFDKSTTMFSKMKWRLTGWNGTKEKILVQRRHPHALRYINRIGTITRCTQCDNILKDFVDVGTNTIESETQER